MLQSSTLPTDLVVNARWLATDEDDGAIVRELLEEGSPQLLNSKTILFIN